ncbi:hypothetical protein K490DRAFT_76026 [Saccharata proteae CBS 121410]|uniref:Nucleolar protein 12 n=1 Tax=Saccharata proteae CBS 121410 TaxID=1314787 RepID=A0A9P4LVM1_9PEZI|nr:hypothetical protein K490DRAFT_76026 [Saccharata proteae CBS 121410]
MAPPRKRVKTQAVEEVTFDDSARAEYLTGFHKRKQERIKHSQQLAAKREREERVAQRKEIRQQRKEDMERHVAEVNALLRKANGSGDEDEDDDDEAEEWGGIEDAPEPVDREDEYIDEDKYTTVTVESVDIGRDGFSRPSENDEDSEGGEAENKRGKDGEKEDAVAKTEGGKKRLWTKEKPKGEAKKKKPKFRYESKAERRVTKSKQREKNSKQANARRGK